MLVHIFFFLVLLGEEKEKGERQRGKKKTDIEVAECRVHLFFFFPWLRKYILVQYDNKSTRFGVIVK